VTVPPNTQATVRIPADDLSQVTESGQPLSQVTGVTSAQGQDHVVAIEIGAGQYDFVSLIRGALLG
jgi:alpha-L-rhamnosidase